MKRFLIILLLLLFISCGSNEETLDLKEFLFLHQDFTVQIDKGDIYNRYVELETATDLKSADGKILTIYKGDNKQQEMLLSKKEWQPVNGTRYLVKAGSG